MTQKIDKEMKMCVIVTWRATVKSHDDCGGNTVERV